MINCVIDCEAKEQPLRSAMPKGIVVHRFLRPGVPIDQQGARTTVNYFRSVASVGNIMPYGIVIPTTGRTELALYNDQYGHNCLSHSKSLIAVAVIGDFRHHSGTDCQWIALEDVCYNIMQVFDFTSDEVVGHDELLHGSSNPDKECPGDYLDMHSLRSTLSTFI